VIRKDKQVIGRTKPVADGAGAHGAMVTQA
jgi:hypothetical protein